MKTQEINGIKVEISKNTYGEKFGRINNFAGSSFDIVRGNLNEVLVKRNFDEPIDIHGTISACIAFKDRNGNISDSNTSYKITPDAKLPEGKQGKILTVLKELDF